MADPISIAASVVALAQLSNAVLLSCYRVYSQVKDADAEIALVINDVELLSGVVADLQNIVNGGPSPQLSSIAALTGPQGPLEGCRTALEDLNRELSPVTQPSRVRRRLQWPFKAKAVREKLELIQKHTQSLHLALSLQQHQDTAGLQQSVKAIDARLRREKVLGWYSSSDPRRNHSAARDKYEPNTANWIFESKPFIEWRNDSCGALWLFGVPGAGKTILSSNIISSLQEQHRVVYYYFDFRDNTKQTVANCLRSIIFQLAMPLDVIPKSVETLYEAYQGLGDPSVAELYDVMVAELDISVETSLVIDALDECTSADRSQFFASFLAENQSSARHCRVLITSRHESDIRDSFARVSIPTLAIQNSAVKADVKVLLDRVVNEHANFRHFPQPVRHQVIDTITIGSEGM